MSLILDMPEPQSQSISRTDIRRHLSSDSTVWAQPVKLYDVDSEDRFEDEADLFRPGVPVSSSFRQISAEFMANQHNLMAFIRGMLRDFQLAEDIFQETWLQVVDALEKGVEIQDVQKWSRGVARNLVLKHWRTQRSAKGSLVVANSKLMEIAELAFEEQDDARDIWERRRRALRDCVAQLPEKSRKILALKYERGLKATAVGEKLGKTAEAILMTISRLRRALAKCASHKLEAMG